ncbi:MAG: DUF3185 family protein [Phycisphaerales bacterium]|nr:DUF3185 family protein [Phycisphaerales bacterium]
MNTQRILGLIVIVVGIGLLIVGLRASDSVASQFSNFFRGTPTDRAVWFTLGGIVTIIAGIGACVVPDRYFGRS